MWVSVNMIQSITIDSLVVNADRVVMAASDPTAAPDRHAHLKVLATIRIAVMTQTQGAAPMTTAAPKRPHQSAVNDSGDASSADRIAPLTEWVEDVVIKAMVLSVGMGWHPYREGGCTIDETQIFIFSYAFVWGFLSFMDE